MNIVHTEASCGWGGQEIRLEESRGLIERGHAVWVLCPIRPPFHKGTTMQNQNPTLILHGN